MVKTVVNGKEVEHLDVIYHTTATKFTILERIKLLLVGVHVAQSSLYTTHEHAHVVGTDCKSWIPPLFPRRHKGMGYSLAKSTETV